MKLSESYKNKLKRLAGVILESESGQRSYGTIKDIANNISIGVGADNGPDEGQIKQIIPHLTREEILEMYDCAGGSPGNSMSMGGFGSGKSSEITNADFNGYKTEMKYGDELSKMGLVHYHKTEKQKTADGEVECKIGWYLTNAGEKVIDHLIDELYEPYVLKEIQKNSYLNKVIERVSGLGGTEFIISLKEGQVPFGVWFDSSDNKIYNISTNGMSEMANDIEEIERSVEFLKEVIDNSKKLQDEFKKVKLKPFSEIYEA